MALQEGTPYEAWFKGKFYISNLYLYGCNAYVVEYKAKVKAKIAADSWAGTIIGYKAKNEWRIWDGTWVFARRDIIFNESKFSYKDRTSSKPVGESTTSEFLNLASIIQLVWKDHCVSSI